MTVMFKIAIGLVVILIIMTVIMAVNERWEARSEKEEEESCSS